MLVFCADPKNILRSSNTPGQRVAPVHRDDLDTRSAPKIILLVRAEHVLEFVQRDRLAVVVGGRPRHLDGLLRGLVAVPNGYSWWVWDVLLRVTKGERACVPPRHRRDAF